MAAGLGGCADLDHDVLARQSSVQATRTRGFIKVQDGCDCHCAYCIIPTVRGDARSRPAGAVLEEARRRVTQGQPEMVLTGISVGDYRDPQRGLELGELMIAVARVPGVERVRLSSVEVIHVKDSLLEALATEPRVCPHLHVPMQSGDDEVLKAMGRHYTASEYLEAIAALRSAVPHVNLTTDVIVGFPTETEAAFERTLDAVDAAGITRVHTFSYSPRPGTVAEGLGDSVPAEEKKRRSRELRGRSEVRSRHHRAGKLGLVEQVLVDKVADTQCSGYTADYTRCYLPAGAAQRGDLVQARLDELHADGIRCAKAPPSGTADHSNKAPPSGAADHSNKAPPSGAADNPICRGVRGYPDYVSFIDQVRSDMTSAMKAGEKDRVGALRLVLSELQKDAKDGGTDELAVLRRERKRRLEAAEQFRDADRPELAEKEEDEARIIESYMPAELDDSELDALVQAAIAETGASDPKDLGQVMKAVMAKAGGRADGKRASARVREALSA
jgi:MiaB/RimO family radical SAM methylthiotransferase